LQGRLRQCGPGLRKLSLRDSHFRLAAPGLEVVELGLRRLELFVGLLLGRDFLLRFQAEQGCLRLDRLPPLDQQLVEPASDRRRDVHILAFDVALKGGRLAIRAASKQQRTGQHKADDVVPTAMRRHHHEKT
jgi:hypothetical protein